MIGLLLLGVVLGAFGWGMAVGLTWSGIERYRQMLARKIARLTDVPWDDR